MLNPAYLRTTVQRRRLPHEQRRNYRLPRGYLKDRRPLRPRQLYGRVFTLKGYGAFEAHFRVENFTHTMSLKTASRSRFPDLAPLLNDPALGKLRQAYLGKRVWAYGGHRLPYLFDVGNRIVFKGSLNRPLRLHRVLRVAWPTPVWPRPLAAGAGAATPSTAQPTS